MKALFIGGTGNISSAITKLALQRGWEIYLLNRGNSPLPEGARSIIADINNDREESIAAKIDGMRFDVVANFIPFKVEQVERDIRLFKGKTHQYFFISSASVYQKPLSRPFIDESTPLANPFWQYSRDKIACEDRLMAEYRANGFPFTVVRPSHTYSERYLPFNLSGKKGGWQILKRIMDGKPVVIPGDGTTLWTLTHSDDFAVAFVGLMGNVHAIGESFHITTDERVTWNQVYESAAAALGKELKPFHVASAYLNLCHPDDISGGLLGDKSNNAIFDNSKVKSLVPEFNATIRFDQGIRKSVAYYLSHLERQVEDPDFDAWCDKIVSTLTKAAGEIRG
ncbi:MAG: SDR family oxidoreductase [Christensenellaceae bacterium]|jgi:nucleoside-diphosphate-sugar epimerase|nr:SDR family oxidoreductase [Christensenellaceae bacterium]